MKIDIQSDSVENRLFRVFAVDNSVSTSDYYQTDGANTFINFAGLDELNFLNKTIDNEFEIYYNDIELNKLTVNLGYRGYSDVFGIAFFEPFTNARLHVKFYDSQGVDDDLRNKTFELEASDGGDSKTLRLQDWEKEVIYMKQW